MNHETENLTASLPPKPQITPRDELHALLEEGATVVTGNRRLYRGIEAEFERRMQATREAWRTPDVLPLPAWLESNWERAVLSDAIDSPALLLSDGQEQRIWERIIEELSPGLLRVEATAAEAREAWRLIQAWRLPATRAAFSYNEDSQAFWRWREAFDRRCRRNRWLPRAKLADDLAQGLKHGWEGGPKQLLLIGFDELTPQQQALADALGQAGCNVRWVDPEGRESIFVRSGWPDVRAEVDAACCWARKRLEAHPEARIGLVVLELGAVRQILTQRLDAVLAPQLQSPDAPGNSPRPWNISLGLPLNDFPLVRTAFQVLRLVANGRLPVAEMSELLCSADLAGAGEEGAARALLDRRIREQREPELSLRSLAYFASQRERPWYCPVLANSVRRALLPERSGSSTANAWARQFGEWLSLFGWANGRALDSDDYQTAQALRELLAEFGALTPVAEAMQAAMALAIFRRSCAGKVFQPQSSPAPVQVLGLYEAIGLEFDHLWVLGMHDGAWPSAPRPNPYLPLPLQREHGLPRSSRERELAVAQDVIARLCAAAGEVVMSTPLLDGEEVLRPSPLIEQLPEVGEEALGLWQGADWRERVYESGRLETVAERAPPVAASATRGGSRLFELQAVCPFRAFAELRLGAKSLEAPGVGLDPLQRGTLLHRALEHFWGAVENSERLARLDTRETMQAIGNAVADAVEEAARRYPQTLRGRFLEIERQRLAALLAAWLEVEGKRSPFRVVQREAQIQAKIDGLEVTLQIDRIDELVDGRRLVIDYKSGKVAPGEWFGSRPEKPQLPLYGVALSDDAEEGALAGVLFAQLKADELCYKGVSEPGRIDGVPGRSREPLRSACDEWPGVVDEWRQVLERLADDYRAGEAAVEPKHGLQTCRKSYCELAVLCRVHEQLPQVAEGETEHE